jgi:hypothetical protein
MLSEGLLFIQVGDRRLLEEETPHKVSARMVESKTAEIP